MNKTLHNYVRASGPGRLNIAEANPRHGQRFSVVKRERQALPQVRPGAAVRRHQARPPGRPRRKSKPDYLMPSKSKAQARFMHARTPRRRSAGTASTPGPSAGLPERTQAQAQGPPSTARRPVRESSMAIT